MAVATMMAATPPRSMLPYCSASPSSLSGGGSAPGSPSQFPSPFSSSSTMSSPPPPVPAKDNVYRSPSPTAHSNANGNGNGNGNGSAATLGLGYSPPPPRPLRRSPAVRRSLPGVAVRISSIHGRRHPGGGHHRTPLLGLPHEVTLGVLKYLTVPDMESLVRAVSGDRRAVHGLKIGILTTLIERTWSSSSPATVWRDVTRDCNRLQWCRVHTEQACPPGVKHPETHLHYRAAELDVARQNWARSYMERPTAYANEAVETVDGVSFKFAGVFNEPHACRVMHQSEVVFCTSTLHDLYESPGEDEVESDRFLVELVAGLSVQRMWDTMYSNPPDYEFSTPIRKLSRLYCLCAHALQFKWPQRDQWMRLSAIPPIDCSGKVAWEDIWAAMQVIAPLTRVSVEQGNDVGHVSSALAALARPTKLLPVEEMPVTSVRVRLSTNPLALAPKGTWDWADICGTWHIAMVQFPQDTPKLVSYGSVNLVPRPAEAIDRAMAKIDEGRPTHHHPRAPAYGATLATGLPKSDALPPIYFNGLTHPAAASRYHLRGIAHLTTDQPPEIRYRVLFRDAETSVDELCFEGVHVGGPGSRRGVIGVAFSLTDNTWARRLELVGEVSPRAAIAEAPSEDTPLAYAAWFWKPEAGSGAGRDPANRV